MTSIPQIISSIPKKSFSSTFLALHHVSRIGVHASKEVVHTEVGHENREEGKGEVEVEPLGLLKHGEALGMQGNGVDEQR